MVTAEQQEKADKWLMDYMLSAIKTERQKKEAIIIITYDPIRNKSTLKRVTYKEIANKQPKKQQK